MAIDRAKVGAEERLDGKFVIHTNDDSLNPEDLALGYKQLQRVEAAWRTLKSGLRLRPVFHWAPHRIQACGDTWRNIQNDLKQIKLAQLLSPHGEVWQVTEPTPETAKRLQVLEIKNPPPILRFA